MARVQIENCGCADFPVKALNSVNLLFPFKDDYIISVMITAAYLQIFEKIAWNYFYFTIWHVNQSSDLMKLEVSSHSQQPNGFRLEIGNS